MFYIILVLILASTDSGPSSTHRCLPSDNCWPDAYTWSKFNHSLHGRLRSVRPPAWPCHDPHYQEQACNDVKTRWSYPFWRADQPGATMESNWEAGGDGRGCFINESRNSTCYQGSVPLYAVNVTHSFQVQRAVTFAAQHNIRLVIKNTGHDYLGRSTAEGSLSIWLHHLKNITFHEEGEFIPAGCTSGENTTATSIGAGVQWGALYQETYNHRQVIVGGGCPSVGAAGGYPQGGGHGPLSPAFGLAADNVLQYEVVTANGTLVTANTCQHQDLFWALRGGGGGTFGVVVSATYRTYPALDNLVYAGYSGNATNKWSLKRFITRFAKLNPSLSDAGWSGYFLVSRLEFSIVYLLPNRNVSFAARTFASVLSYAKQDRNLRLDGSLQSFPSFLKWYLATQCAGEADCSQINGAAFATGTPISFSSRLIPRRLLQSSPSRVAEAFIKILDMQLPVYASMVAGGQVSVWRDNAVNPAWREALWLVNIAQTWQDNSTKPEKELAAELLSRGNKVLIDMTPGSGSYMNEADYNEPDWRASLYGSNYKKLRDIKTHVDPKGLFHCHHCVGEDIGYTW